VSLAPITFQAKKWFRVQFEVQLYKDYFIMSSRIKISSSENAHDD